MRVGQLSQGILEFMKHEPSTAILIELIKCETDLVIRHT